MARFLKREIDGIIKWRYKELEGLHVSEFVNTFIGYYQPSNASCSYRVYVINYHQELVKVVTLFGVIKWKWSEI